MANNKKQKKNITGLRNQLKTAFHQIEHIDNKSDNKSDDDKNWNVHIKFDSNRPCWENEDSDDEELEDSENEKDDVDVEEEAGEVDWRNEGLHVSMMLIAINNGDDPQDEDWIPHQLQRKYKARIGKFTMNSSKQVINQVTAQPKEYKKGPDVGSKSERTCYQYKNLLKDQKMLETFKFMRSESVPSPLCGDNVEMLENTSDDKTGVSELMPLAILIKVENESPYNSPQPNFVTLPVSKPENHDGVQI